MSSHKSQNLNLHLWEPDDNFLRTEFNENFAAIDHSMTRASDHSSARFDALGRDLYSAAVRQSIATGAGGTASCVWVNGMGSLDEVGSGHGWDGKYGLHFGSTRAIHSECFVNSIQEISIIDNVPISENKSRIAAVAFTSDGDGTLDTIAIWHTVNKHFSSEAFLADVKLFRMDTGRLVGRYPLQLTGFGGSKTEFKPGFPLAANVSYRMEFSVPYDSGFVGRGGFSIKESSEVTAHNAVLILGEWNVPTSRSARVTPPGWAKSAIGLVHWKGDGSVTLKVNGKALPVTATRAAVNGLNEACQETELSLASLPAGTLSVLLEMAPGEEEFFVYDFGLIWK